MKSLNNKLPANYWDIIWTLARTDFKARYHGSVIGYSWSLLKPFLIYLVLYLVFSIFMQWEIEHYQLQLLIGIIIWNFFAEGTMLGTISLIRKTNIITKIYLPKFLIIIASTLSALLTFVLNLGIFLVIYLLSGLSLSWGFLFMPLLVLLLYGIIVGISLSLGVLQVKWRDVTQIWDVLLQAGFFLTPVIYPLALIPSDYLSFMALNPVAGVITLSRNILIEGIPLNLSLLGLVMLITAGLVVIGLLIYKLLSRKIAEEL